MIREVSRSKAWRACIESGVSCQRKRLPFAVHDELAAFRRWYATFDAEIWDRQFEADVKAGKLDAFAEKALRAHTSGQSKQL